MNLGGGGLAAPVGGAEPAPLILFEGVTKRFGETVAIEGLTLAIREGEFFALLGPSGCGKTTLMRMAAGFEQPSAGRVLLGGADMAGVPPYQRPVNMMFQSYALFPHMSVEANVAFGLKQQRLAKAEIARRVDEMLDMVRLTALRRRRPHQLSGGERQRVALARSLARRPKVLLLDEPMAALDKKLRESTRFELSSLQRRLGLTFVIVTHDQEEAMTVADRIAVMDHGRVVQVATPAEIYEQPNSRYVADFIGDINLFAAEVRDSGAGAVRLDCAGIGVVAVSMMPGTARPAGAAWFAIRPEKLAIALAPPPDTAVNSVAGEVFDIGYLGDVSVYRVRLAGGAVMKATDANRTRLVARPIGLGDPVWLTWAEDAGLVLTR